MNQRVSEAIVDQRSAASVCACLVDEPPDVLSTLVLTNRLTTARLRVQRAA